MTDCPGRIPGSESAGAESEHAGWMRRCLDLAEEARRGGEAPVGSVIVRRGARIAEASEEVKTGCDPSAHAEILAIRRACRVLGALDLSDCVLYTNVEPCWMCSYAIRETRIRSVVIDRAVPGIGGATSPYSILTDAYAGSGPAPEVRWMGEVTPPIS